MSRVPGSVLNLSKNEYNELNEKTRYKLRATPIATPHMVAIEETLLFFVSLNRVNIIWWQEKAKTAVPKKPMFLRVIGYAQESLSNNAQMEAEFPLGGGSAQIPYTERRTK